MVSQTKPMTSLWFIFNPDSFSPRILPVEKNKEIIIMGKEITQIIHDNFTQKY